MSGFLLAHGHWEQAAALHQAALTAARQAGDRPGQAGALMQLGPVQWLTGDYPAAAASLTQALAAVPRPRRPARPGRRPHPARLRARS